LVEDSVLRLAFKNGTPKALAEVYREYARGLYTFVQQKLRARQIAADYRCAASIVAPIHSRLAQLAGQAYIFLL